ncbi:MAG: zinc-ribbon and DUF3426 domain-containing protein [Cocleimonas sp.]
MFTQCEHCKAIFNVKMREITIAGGQLRCGECQQIFSTKENLSTTMQEPYSKLSNKTVNIDSQSHPNPVIERSIDQPRSKQDQVSSSINKTSSSYSKKILIVTALSLVALLLLQLFYNYRHVFSGEPQRLPDQVQMLNHNIFAHPNESGVLMISATMENTAKQVQPYPVLEVKLSNAKSEVIALRRFTPEEYLDNPSKGMLLQVKQPTSIKLKIKDPGESATRFQFDFL